MFALPFSLVQYLPNFLCGSLLLLFGVDIVSSWLFGSFRKFSRMGENRPPSMRALSP